MPELDGLTVAAAIRQHEQQTGVHLPIIAMTAHAMDGDRERCVEAGMDGYVSKRAYLRVRGQGHPKQGLKASIDPGEPQV